MGLRTNTEAHTHSHTHTLLCVNYFFFFRFCSCGLRTSFVSVCEIVRARAVISSHIRYHNFPYFYCARRIQQKKLGILISSAKYWTPGTFNSQTLAHTFLLGSLSLRSIQPDFRFPPDVNFTWPHHTTVSANFPQTTFGDTLLLAEFTPKCPLNSCNSFSFACECPLGQVKLHPILVSTIEIRELKWTPFPGVVVKGGPGFCQVSFALCQTYSSPSLVNVAN